MTNSLKDSGHPIWTIARLLTLMAAMVLFSWINASNFDSTEHAFLIQMFVVLFGVEGAVQFARYRREKDETDS